MKPSKSNTAKSSIDPKTEKALRKMGFISRTETLPEDIFVAGYPKSGNTWLQNMLVALWYEIDIQNLPLKLIHELVPGDRMVYFKRYSTPGLFKTHKPPRESFRRVINLVRDGRDVMVSYTHHLNAVHNTDYPVLHYVKQEDIYPMPWHLHVEAWLENRFNADVLVVKYEDLKQDAARELERICNFTNLERTREQIEFAVQQASFDSMREREQRFGHNNVLWPEDKTFVRSGVVGTHAKEMPSDALSHFLKKAGSTLKKLGYLD